MVKMLSADTNEWYFKEGLPHGFCDCKSWCVVQRHGVEISSLDIIITH